MRIVHKTVPGVLQLARWGTTRGHMVQGQKRATPETLTRLSDQPVSRMQCRVAHQSSRVGNELTGTSHTLPETPTTSMSGNKKGFVRLHVLGQEDACKVRIVCQRLAAFFFPCVTTDVPDPLYQA